jgi:hypothetical protein
MNKKKPVVFYTIDCRPNVVILVLSTQNGKNIVAVGPKRIADVYTKLTAKYSQNICWVGFNNRHYAHHLLLDCVKHQSVEHAYRVSQGIITGPNRLVQTTDDIIDLMDFLHGRERVSLDELAHRLEFENIDPIPKTYDKPITKEECLSLIKHNLNYKHKVIKKLWETLSPTIQSYYNLKGLFDCENSVYVGDVPEQILYNALPIIEKPETKISFGDHKLEITAGARIVLEHMLDGEVNVELAFPLFDVKLGYGGLHAAVKGLYKNVYSYDVNAYYPNIIVQNKLGSKTYRSVLKSILDRRKAAQKNGDDSEKSFKLLANIITGKLRDKYSGAHLYNPSVGVSMCLLGQFYLIDLMEKCSNTSIIYVNTDEIITSEPISEDIISEWMHRTGFELKRKTFTKLAIESVNSLVGIYEDGRIKRTGSFSRPIISKNVPAQIIQKLVVNKLFFNKGFAETLEESTKLYDFLFLVKRNQPFKTNALLLNGVATDESFLRGFLSNEGPILTRRTPSREAEVFKNDRFCLVTTQTTFSEVHHRIKYHAYIERANKILKRLGIQPETI